MSIAALLVSMAATAQIQGAQFKVDYGTYSLTFARISTTVAAIADADGTLPEELHLPDTVTYEDKNYAVEEIRSYVFEDHT